MADSQIRAFYSGKNFLITGGTGFVGICLLERILRSLPDAGKIYLLMRPKGKTVGERLEKIMEIPIFATLQTNTPDIFKKLVPIAGDVGEPNLGLSPEDRQLIDDVNIIIHSAANIDLAQSAKRALQINVAGTRRIMELACQLKGLKAMVYVSTAYANFFIQEAQEILYDIPEDAERIVNLVETLDDNELSLAERSLLKTHKLFYTFSKQLAEHEIAKYSNRFPCIIVRPSMILTTWKEPVCGWTCSKAGMLGFLMSISIGIVRRFPLARKNIADCIPVDVLINQLLVAGWHASKSCKGLCIYHCTSSTVNPVYWGQVESLTNKFVHMYPLKCALWYPRLKLINSLTLYRISTIFVHVIPAIFLELYLRLTGRSILSRLRKGFNTLRSLEWFVFNEYIFDSSNTIQLAGELNEIDRQLFYIDVSKLDWKQYINDLFMGCRKYLLGEDESTLEDARHKDAVLLVVHMAWKVLLLSLFWYFVACFTGLTMTESVWCVPVLYILYGLL